jgi:DNA-binding transcriptional ArsR family regulator
MTLGRCVVRFSENELRALDDLRGTKGIPRASLVRAAVRVLIDGAIPVALILEHLREIRRERRATSKRPRPVVPAGAPSVRRRVLEALDAHPGGVLTPSCIAGMIGDGSRGTVRNALLALSQQGRVEKVGVGQYRARARAPVGVQVAAVAAE